MSTQVKQPHERHALVGGTSRGGSVMGPSRAVAQLLAVAAATTPAAQSLNIDLRARETAAALVTLAGSALPAPASAFTGVGATYGTGSDGTTFGDLVTFITAAD